MIRACVTVLLLFLLSAFSGTSAHAYSLLTHEELIDLTWQSSIVPLLLSRYPTLTPAQLEEARAYAYGGCVMQDIGYYPLGDRFFSNLTHYVRSGDFVVNLFRDAGNADELAFAVGALSHYIGDSYGHADATNLAVPREFPKLRARYGPVVSYAEGEHQHVQTEFAFDIDQIAHHRMAPAHYLRHIGLGVPIKQVALAFYQTYGLSEDFTQSRGRRINVGAYRFAVRRFIPRIAYAVTLLHRGNEPPELPTAELAQLQREVLAVEQQNHWDQYRRKPGPGTYLLAGLLYVLPKVGPLKLVAIKGPTSQTEQDYIVSVLRSEASLNNALRRFTPPPTGNLTAGAATERAASRSSTPPSANAGAGQNVPRDSADPAHPLPNRDLDTGRPVQPAGYRLTDQTYAELLHDLARAPLHSVPPGVKENVLAYFADLSLPFAMKSRPQGWAAVLADLEVLRTMPTGALPHVLPERGGWSIADFPPASTYEPDPERIFARLSKIVQVWSNEPKPYLLTC